MQITPDCLLISTLTLSLVWFHLVCNLISSFGFIRISLTSKKREEGGEVKIAIFMPIFRE